MTDPAALPSRPRRRAEDREVEQLVELIRAQADVLAKLSIRMGAVERGLGDVRRLIEDMGVERASHEQRIGMTALLEWWEDTARNPRVRAADMERMVRYSTVVQSVTAVILLALTVYTLVKR